MAVELTPLTYVVQSQEAGREIPEGEPGREDSDRRTPAGSAVKGGGGEGAERGEA